MFSAGRALALAVLSLAAPAAHSGWLEDATPLHRAAWNGDMVTVMEQLESGVDPNIRDDLQRTPLHFAAYKGRISTTPVEDRVVGEPDPGNYQTAEMVEYMLEKGADPNLRDKDESTPLMEAVPNGHTEIVEMLLKAGADPDIENRHGESPLSVAEHRAKKHGHQKIVELLQVKEEL